MELKKLSLLTIIADELLKDRICKQILLAGATGYTYVEAEGEGARGVREDSFAGTNLKIQVICPAPVAEEILRWVAEHLFDNYAVIAWLSEVSVVRGAHYAKSAP
jgi:hypothetical protein